MKSKLLILALIALIVGACNRSETVEKTTFSATIPTGYHLSDEDLSIPDFTESAIMVSPNGSISIMTFPAGPEPDKFLYAQTMGGNNAALHACTFGELESVNIGGVDAYSIDLNGIVSGQNAEGTIYAFPKDDYLFMIIAVSSDGAPKETASVVSSIKVKEDPRPAEERNAALLEAIVNLSRNNLPNNIDQLTQWTDVEVDNERNCLVMTMTLAGNSDDYDIESLRNVLENGQRDGIVESFRANRSADYLIEIPARLGYDFEYIYKTADDGVEAGRLHISNADLNP